VTTRPVFGLVLAGGESRRMGQDKALLIRDGKSQLAHIAELLGRVTTRVFVSTRSSQRNDKERAQFEQIVDRYDNMGPVAGILSALEEHPAADWLVVACDLPNIDESTLRYLLDHRSVQQPFTAFRSSHDGLPEPLCALYSEGSATVIRKFIADGLVCPRKILIRSECELLEQPDPRSLDNVNTPADLERSVLETVS